MSNSILVFKLEYVHTAGWGSISNFITKFSENLPLELSDVAHVSSCVMTGERFRDNFALTRELNRGKHNFLPIKKPEKIYSAVGQFDIVFFVSVEFRELYDVVDLQNLYLLHDSCEQCRIITLISGEQSEYHKTSHFFAFLTQDKGGIYNSIFFECEKVMHLQTAGIGVLTKFLPLMPVNASSNKLLRQKVVNFVSTKILEDIIRGKTKGKEIPRILEGAFKCVYDGRKKLEKCDSRQCASYLGDLNILSFLLLSFSLEGIKEGFSDFREFNDELQKVSIWSNGCMQLIENIIFHSSKKRGGFSFRVLESESDYIKEKYKLGNGQTKWLEMMIADYPGCYSTLNIAEKFQENLLDTEMKARFQTLTPRDFFGENRNDKIVKAWEHYYTEKKNIVNHYGLKMFQNVVQKVKGHFIAQSFSTHHPQKNEVYYDHDQETAKIFDLCMNGTNYSILYPIIMDYSEVVSDDFAIESFGYKYNDADNIMDYVKREKVISLENESSSSQEKVEFINKMAKDLTSDDNNDPLEEKFYVSINAEDIGAEMAEVMYKSVILAMLQNDCKFHVVLYGCQGEFVQTFLDVSYLGCWNLRTLPGYAGGKQIVLYTSDFYEEVILLPEDWNRTLFINKSNNFSRETRWKDYFEKWQNSMDLGGAQGEITRYPFDVFVGNGQDSIFERYVEKVVNRNIQGENLGCKIEDVHMRLGSTIHVNHFYEAEILFGNSLFVERFAYLIVNKLMNAPLMGAKPVDETDKITLYGYSNYSEQTVFCTMQLLQKIIPGIDVDYAILERESEDRGYTHVDRIRYSYFFGNGEDVIIERKKYFRERKIICIIPISSTLKTNEKMINLFAEENGQTCKDSILRNFELILVGSSEENQYWVKKDGKRISGNEGMMISPEPEFFVEVVLDYMEPLECRMCFPEQVIDERPLVEVNAASTIPNQAFDLKTERDMLNAINEDDLQKKIAAEEENLNVLKDVMLYRHLERNENHFLFYFQTERLIVEHSERIKQWLKGIKDTIKISENDYIILFCPAHFSNAGFVEYVNSYVFGGAAVVIRDDVDKEYRCNFKTKYSNLKGFAKKITECNKESAVLKRSLRLFYVDDVITTGRTFQRAKSLAQSILSDAAVSERQKYMVFDGIFVLIDRNSKSSRWQYTGINEETHLYTFRTVHISSVRNHGDACVYCNLANESRILKQNSSTKEMEKYWRGEEEKFCVKPLARYLKDLEDNQEETEGETDRDESGGVKKDRAFRRFVCTNNAMVFLDKSYHGNYKDKVLNQILVLVLDGSRLHKGEEAEYFLSYCKVLSRPFRVFDKVVKEAVFDLLLIVCHSVIFRKTYKEVVGESEKKTYLSKKEIMTKLLEIEKFVNLYFINRQLEQSLIKVLLKQLTEMKSNYIIRENCMEQILKYASGLKEDRGGFIQYYKYLIKKLIGASSDTSKCLWLDRMLYTSWKGEISRDLEDIYLENIWLYQEAFKKLKERLRIFPKEWKDILYGRVEGDYKERLVEFESKVLDDYIKPYQFKDFISLLEMYSLYNKEGLTYDGKIFVASNYLLSHFISSDFKNGLGRVDAEKIGNLGKVDVIARCLQHIMMAGEVIIMMEFNAECDIWENKLWERYDNLASGQSSSQNNGLKRIAKVPQKEYIILGSSIEKNSGWTMREKEVIGIVQQFQKEHSGMEWGRAYDLKKGFFLWELGQETEYPVYIFVKWEKSDNNKSDLDMLNHIRTGMQYYWQLNDSVFNKSNEAFFYELAHQRKKSAIFTKKKAYTHTKYDIKLTQYDHMLKKQKYCKYYQSDLLMLLADLNVSEHYRNSLTAEYYLKGVPVIGSRWDSQLSIFKGQKEFYVTNSDMVTPIRMTVSTEVLFEGDLELQGSDEIVCFDYTNSERETFLLLYSLMINAATNNRGKIVDHSVTVYCSKTQDGRLRMTNQVGEGEELKTPEKIMEELKFPPEDEDQGISLWSMSRYVKRIAAGIIDFKLRKYERNGQQITPDQLEVLKERMQTLLGQEFQVFVENVEIKGVVYFSVLIPILAEKYKKLE